MSEKTEYTVKDEHHGKRLDAFLAQMAPSYSRSALTQMIKDGFVQIDGKEVTKPSLKLSSAQIVSLSEQQREELENQPQDIPLDVIYEDEYLIVINKPVGLVVHPGSGIKDGTILNAMLYHYPETATLARACIVLRLD